jgi:hypothetical protein
MRDFALSGEDKGSCGSGESLNIASFEVEERDHVSVYVSLSLEEELDAVLETEWWRI